MGKELIIRNEISINAATQKVWDVLINPEQTKKYMFGCETVSDWKVGSPLLWKALYEGKEVVFVKGIILKIEAEKFLAYTTIDPHSSMPDVPENYLTVTYSLSGQNGQMLLTVTQGDYNAVPEGEKRYNEAEAAGGWSSILTEIKKVAEQI